MDAELNSGREDLRVLHVDHTTAPGGAEFALMRMLDADHGWNGTIMLPRSKAMDAGLYSPLEVDDRTRIKFLGPSQSSGATTAGPLSLVAFGLRLFGQALAIRASTAYRRADVIHANTSRAALYVAIASWGTRKPLVVHLRDTVDRVSLGNAGYRLFTLIALKRATGVIANSAATLESARPHLRSGTLKWVVPSAAGISADRPATPEVRSDVRSVGMVARIDPWKGQDLLIRAFARAFAGTHVRLRLAGGASFGHGEYVAKLKKLASELGVLEQMDLLGQVADVEGLLADLDVCVQASHRPEPLGQNVLQYLAAGKVVIATRQGGPGEWITDEVNGLLFDIDDVEALADALTRVASDVEMRESLALNALQTPNLKTDAEVASEHLKCFRESYSVASQ